MNSISVTLRFGGTSQLLSIDRSNDQEVRNYFVYLNCSFLIQGLEKLREIARNVTERSDLQNNQVRIMMMVYCLILIRFSSFVMMSLILKYLNHYIHWINWWDISGLILLFPSYIWSDEWMYGRCDTSWRADPIYSPSSTNNHLQGNIVIIHSP